MKGWNDKVFLFRSQPAIITEDFCGIEPATVRPEPAETRRPPVIDEESLAEFYDTTSSIILGAILSFIFLCLIIVCVCIGKYMNRYVKTALLLNTCIK